MKACPASPFLPSPPPRPSLPSLPSLPAPPLSQIMDIKSKHSGRLEQYKSDSGGVYVGDRWEEPPAQRRPLHTHMPAAEQLASGMHCRTAKPASTVTT